MTDRFPEPKERHRVFHETSYRYGKAVYDRIRTQAAFEEARQEEEDARIEMMAAFGRLPPEFSEKF